MFLPTSYICRAESILAFCESTVLIFYPIFFCGISKVFLHQLVRLDSDSNDFCLFEERAFTYVILIANFQSLLLLWLTSITLLDRKMVLVAFNQEICLD